MTLHDLMISDVTDVFIQEDDFASPLLRYVDGNAGDIVQFSGVVLLQPPETDDGRGRGYRHVGHVYILSDVTIFAREAVYYDGNRYEVEHVSDEMQGMKTVRIIRYAPEAKGAKVLRNGDL